MANSMVLSNAEKNALSVSYDVLGTHVEMDLDFVKRYLVRGNPEKISDQEIVFFMNTCKVQKLNPLVAGEVYCIKFGSEPAQMVVGKGAYLRRAFEHPDYLCKEDGIIVMRNKEIVKKEGCCVYPGETLLGGWCRVFYLRSGKERSTYKEVAFEEYNKGQANWKSKPATMINKVAVSQCVRDAFPKDYEGLYSEEEMVASGAIPPEQNEVQAEYREVVETVDADPLITNEKYQEILRYAAENIPSHPNTFVKRALQSLGKNSGSELRESEVPRVYEILETVSNELQQKEP